MSIIHSLLNQLKAIKHSYWDNILHSYSLRISTPWIYGKLVKQSEEKKNTEILTNGYLYNSQVPGFLNLCSHIWNDDNYKCKVMACFTQAVYLLELDRQLKREGDAGLAPKWWKPFKYKAVEKLVDERDESIFGATLEWDNSDKLLRRPSKAPQAIIALRGTLIRAPTIRRDIEDDLRILTMEDLRGSCRFHKSLEAVKTLVERYGNNEVCMAGHSLGAGLVLQVGKALAQEGIYVEAHLFNPPSVSFPMGLRRIGDKFEILWNVFKGAVPGTILHSEMRNKSDECEERSEVCEEKQKWVPHFYVNNNDYICCSYCDAEDKLIRDDEKVAADHMNHRVDAKLFVVSKGPTKFLEAHGIKQWWSYDSDMQMAVLRSSKLIQQQLGSLSSPCSPQ